MKIKEIVQFLETIAPPALQEDYDNAGLITGNGVNDVSGILICLDSTEEVIEEAVQKNCNMVIAHHPILFSPLKKITGSSYVERTIIQAIKNNIAIYAMHTNLDNVTGGVNKKIAEKLELVNCRILRHQKGNLKKLVTFCPTADADKIRQALFDAGGGAIGNYDNCSFNVDGTGTFKGNEATQPYAGEKNIDHRESETRIEIIFPSWLEITIIKALLKTHPYEEVAYDIYRLENIYENTGAGLIGKLKQSLTEMDFLIQLKERMQTNCIRYTKLLNKPVETVAVCGGSGSYLLNDAIQAEADIFISADFTYHRFFDADYKIVIADIGHYESEQFTIELLYGLLLKKFPNFAVHFTKLKTNPINYI